MAGDGHPIADDAQVAAAPVVIGVIGLARLQPQTGQVHRRVPSAVPPVDDAGHQPGSERPPHRQGEELRQLVLEEVAGDSRLAVGREDLAEVLQTTRADGGEVVAGEHHPPRQPDQGDQSAHLVEDQIRLVVSGAHQDAVGVVGPEPVVEEGAGHHVA